MKFARLSLGMDYVLTEVHVEHVKTARAALAKMTPLEGAGREH